MESIPSVSNLDIREVQFSHIKHIHSWYCSVSFVNKSANEEASSNNQEASLQSQRKSRPTESDAKLSSPILISSD